MRLLVGRRLQVTVLDERGQTMTQAMQLVTAEQQAQKLLGLVAGYIGTRTVEIGLSRGIVAALAASPDGLTAETLARQTELDPFYTSVWCRSALAQGIIERSEDAFRLAQHVGGLLLDTESPTQVGGVFTVITRPEIFDVFDANFATGERTWWDETSNEWIQAVSATGRAFYLRLIPGGLAIVPDLAARLDGECRILDTACGAGFGLSRLAEAYPGATLVGADGDSYSLQLADEARKRAGLGHRVELIHTPLEDLDHRDEFDLVINNISMHECRDIDRVTANVRAALGPGGFFVISDFPFPETDEKLQTVPGRIMAGIQFFEALIDDQLVPVDTYVELLQRHGFVDVGTTQLSPVHSVTWGRKG